MTENEADMPTPDDKIEVTKEMIYACFLVFEEWSGHLGRDDLAREVYIAMEKKKRELSG